jgi:uncharacterized protein YecT (DUF1311 family)
MMHHKFQRNALFVFAFASLLSCRGRSPDAGGDTALARDLAEAQLGAMATPARPSAPAATDSVARTDVSLAALDTEVTARIAPPTPPARSAAVVPKPSHTDPCTLPAPTSQGACLARGVARSNARLGAVYRSIVRAVRKQQRVARRAPDPPYVAELGKAQRVWISWRDAECKRRASGAVEKLWAVPRSKCVGELTNTRVAELRGILSKVHGQ